MIENTNPSDSESPPAGDATPVLASEPAESEFKAPNQAPDQDVEESEVEEPSPGRFGRLNIAFPIVVGLLMFIAGGLTGYFGRPFISPTPTPPPDERQQVLDMIISKTRHWKGNAKAPVAVIEFSDYQ